MLQGRGAFLGFARKPFHSLGSRDLGKDTQLSRLLEYNSFYLHNFCYLIAMFPNNLYVELVLDFILDIIFDLLRTPSSLPQTQRHTLSPLTVFG